MTDEKQLPAQWNPALFEKLTPMEQRFVLHPLAFTDPIKAATEAGYTEGSARAKAHIMRKQLMYFIMPRHEERMNKIGVATIDRICEELEAIAFANEADYYDTVDVDGETIKVLKDITRLPERMQRAIKHVEYTTVIADDDKTYQRLTGIELHDKQKALVELAEIRGAHDPRFRKPENPALEETEMLQHLDPADMEMIEKLYDKARARAEKAKNAKPVTAKVVKK